MKTRVMTGTLMGIFFIPVFVIGGWLLMSVLGVLSVIATIEMTHMMSKKTIFPKGLFVFAGLGSALFYVILVFGLNRDDLAMTMLPLMLGLILVGSLLMVFVETMTVDIFAKIVLAILYPVLGFTALVYIREVGLAFLGLLFVVTVSTDVFAYFVGVTFGNHRLAPKISPKKSIEGSLGGLFFAAVFSVLYVLVTNQEGIVIDLSITLVVLLALVTSVMAQVGDLVASKMKRNYEIKDFSQLFPGHGGVMDRFDSSIFAAMMFVLVMMLGLI